MSMATCKRRDLASDSLGEPHYLFRRAQAAQSDHHKKNPTRPTHPRRSTTTHIQDGRLRARPVPLPPLAPAGRLRGDRQHGACIVRAALRARRSSTSTSAGGRRRGHWQHPQPPAAAPGRGFAHASGAGGAAGLGVGRGGGKVLRVRRGLRRDPPAAPLVSARTQASSRSNRLESNRTESFSTGRSTSSFISHTHTTT